MFKFTDISIILFITTAINIVTTWVVWKRKNSPHGLYFALGMMCVTFWTFAVALGYAAVPLPLKIIFAKMDAVGYSLALILFLYFGMYFAGLDEWANKRWLRVCLFLIIIFNILLVGTNEWHGWIWRDFKSVGDHIVVFEHGPGFFWLSLSEYPMYIAMIAMLLYAWRTGSDVLQRQARLLFYASLFPIVSNMVYLYGIKGTEGVDWSSLTFSITGVFFLWALYGVRFMDIVPVARDKLIASLSDGMIVVDTISRIIDINPAAASMLGVSTKSLIGKGLQEVMPQTHARLVKSTRNDIRTEFETGDNPKQYFDVLLSPLFNKDQTQQLGNLIVFRNITERKLAEQALENRFLVIHNLNKELQEAQTQIVEQQRALATAEERQRLGRNLHDSVNQSIHSLMLFSETLIALLQNGETEQAIRAAERIHESGKQALKEVRLLVHEGQAVFMSGYADLIQAIETRLNMVERRAGIQADLSYDLSALERSPQEWMENIYWIILEGLNNSLKHSQASRVHVSIVDDVDQLTVEVKDNGTGFETGQERGGGFGMKSMQERAEILGGVISVESSPGHGTRVKCVVEIPRQ